MRLVHLTDPHLTSLDDVRFTGLCGKRWSGYLSWRKNRSRKHLPAVLERLCGAVRAESADQVLLTGDLAQIGLEREIEQSANWLASLAPPGRVMLVPGNHDAYAEGSEALLRRAWADYLFHGRDSDLQGFPVLRRLPGISLVGLSSACVTPVFMAGGKLGAAQLMDLDAMLAQAANERNLVCLLIHHPPLPGMTSKRKALADANELQAVLERYPPMLVFHGHLHHNREHAWGASRIFCTAAASSVSDASYRVMDIHQQDGAWTVSMKLKTIAIDEAGQVKFATADEQSWEMSR
jgi:3',5'-cyclic AMP phosphodiesterase CpdA